MKRQKFFYAALISLGALIGLWLIGMMLFVARVSSYSEPSIDEAMASTDAIVVLTGGSERVAVGLHLMRAGKAKKLLISGVHPHVGASHILAHSDIAKETQDCCVTLGHEADNTIGNALEARAYMEKQGFHSLRLVTSHYHMPRSLTYFRALLPDVEITANPVSPDVVNLSDWWHSPGTASLLFMEYNKYLYANLCVLTGVM